MSEVILNEPRIGALIGQGEAASVAKPVRAGRQGKPDQFALSADRKPRAG